VGDHLGNDFGSSELGIQRANFPMRHPLSHGTRSSPSAPAGASCVCDRNRRFYLQPAKFTVARFDDVDTDRWPPGIAKGQQEMGACHGSNYRARPVGEAMQTEVIGRSVVRPFSVIAQSYDAERPPAAAMAPASRWRGQVRHKVVCVSREGYVPESAGGKPLFMNIR
jgi:hypothetical protein